MAKPEGLIVEEDIVAQEFDLESITGKDFSSDESLLTKVGNEIIDYIVKRSADNKGIGGKALRSPYSKEYTKTTEFKLHGKSPKDVNMRLTGDMIKAISILDKQDSLITVGIEDENAPKAHGHMTGKNGEVPAMKREFFGLTKKELSEVLSKFKSDIKQLPDKPSRIQDLFQSDVQQVEGSTAKRTFGSLTQG